VTIYKTSGMVDTYRARARAKDIEALTGRDGRPDLTEFITAEILRHLTLRKDAVLVDVGCGKGLLLQKAGLQGVDCYAGRLIGILPTTEEVTRVRSYLLATRRDQPQLISIELGLAERLPLPDNLADVVVCNSVLHGAGQTIANVEAALRQFNRIMKPDAQLFIGEMPDRNEIPPKNHGDSIPSWLWWLLRGQGLRSFLSGGKQILRGILTAEPFIIAPRQMFYMPPQQFCELLGRFGFTVIKCQRFMEINAAGAVYEHPTRWNYLARKQLVSSLRGLDSSGSDAAL
jgi:SAM-dependent methyltransferase